MESHPLADLIPPMTDGEYQNLKENIAENGQLDPIMLFEGKVLDGRHRLRACEELGIQPKTRDYDGSDPASYALAVNIPYRRLSQLQIAESARLFLPHLREEAAKRKKRGAEEGAARRWDASGAQAPEASHDAGRVRDQIKKLTGGAVTGWTVEVLDRVAVDAPDLHEKVLARKMGIRPAYNELRKREKAADESNPVAKPANGGNRTEQIRSLAAEGHNAAQIGKKLGISRQYVMKLANEHDIQLVEHRIGKQQTKINPAEVVEKLVASVESNVEAAALVEPRIGELDPEDVKYWSESLAKSFRRLQKFRRNLERSLNHE